MNQDSHGTPSLKNESPFTGDLGNFGTERSLHHRHCLILRLSAVKTRLSWFCERKKTRAAKDYQVFEDLCRDLSPITVLVSLDLGAEGNQVSPHKGTKNVPPGPLPALKVLISTCLLACRFHFSTINLGSKVSISVWLCSLPVCLFQLTIPFPQACQIY